MASVCVVSGSRADRGLLEWPMLALRAAGFDVELLEIWGVEAYKAQHITRDFLIDVKPNLMMVLGDRFEILNSVIAAHLLRVPIAHIGGGDVTEGSYDDAMRDCISRMASIHFVTSTSAMARLTALGFNNVHLVGNPGIDAIRHKGWKSNPPFDVPYVVVSYQAETIDGVNEISDVIDSLPVKHKVFLLPNPDRGSEAIADVIRCYSERRSDCTVYDQLPHDQFLNLLFHCDEFIGNSSSMLYEAPELGVRTRMVGKRQRGRTIPWGDGNAARRIAKILTYASF